ncbi:hypothetical protein GCM10010207_84490 [Streptomyces atratus]|nr:hypothetical protein GCM10010207_84490 [Streptomyces atratus]
MTIRRPADHRATSSGEEASPATTSEVIPGIESGGMTARAAGGMVACVTPCSATRVARAASGSSRSWGASTSAAPESSAIASSQNAASKLGEANCRTRLPGPTSNCSIWLETRLAAPACETTTPLGRPVEPEV